MDFCEFRTNWEDFAEIYRDAEEQLLHKMPAPRGMGVTTTAFVDSSHAAQLNYAAFPFRLCDILESCTHRMVQ